MSWAKQNKFLAGYATVVGVLIVLCGALLFFGYSKWSEAAQARQQANNELGSLESAQPYPNQEKLDEAKSLAAADEVASKDLLDKIREKYDFPLPTAINAGTWAADLNTRLDAVKNSASVNDVELFEGFNLGMGAYAGGTQPTPENLPELSFKVAAIDALVSQLIAAGVSSVTFLDRQRLPGEPGYKEPESTGKNRFSSRNEDKSFKTYQVELIFETASKGRGLDIFLRNIASHPKFFFVVRLVRIENERQLPASHGDSIKYQTAEDKKMIEDATNSDNPVFPKVRIQGREKLTVYAVIDIIRFNDQDEEGAGSAGGR